MGHRAECTSWRTRIPWCTTRTQKPVSSRHSYSAAADRPTVTKHQHTNFEFKHVPDLSLCTHTRPYSAVLLNWCHPVPGHLVERRKIAVNDAVRSPHPTIGEGQTLLQLRHPLGVRDARSHDVCLSWHNCEKKPKHAPNFQLRDMKLSICSQDTFKWWEMNINIDRCWGVADR